MHPSAAVALDAEIVRLARARRATVERRALSLETLLAAGFDPYDAEVKDVALWREILGLLGEPGRGPLT